MKNDFKILANTFCLNSNNTEVKTLLDGKKKFKIPIFQRPYSWNEAIVDKFLKDIIDSYFKDTDEDEEGQLFIGTMQLGKPDNNEYEVIDGQQRLTTLLLLIKVLKTFEKDLTTDWLSTLVNSGEQQKSLSYALNVDLDSIDDLKTGILNNRYLENLLIIKGLLDEIVASEEGDENEFNVNDFISHLYTNLYFVVIETHAGLSKTLQIFDTINTTGLDLNGADIFKIRMYEYYTSVKMADKDIFNEISALYEKVEKLNKKHTKYISFLHILTLYQYSIIAKYDLPNTLYKLNSTTFFERLFDSILNTNQWKNFTKAKDVNLSLDSLSNLIDSRFEYEIMSINDLDVLASHHFIGWSRYSRYWILRVLFFHKFRQYANFSVELDKFTLALSRVFLAYSIRYKKSVNEIHRFVYSLNELILEGNIEEIQKMIENKLAVHSDDLHFENLLSFNLTSNRKRKDIIFRIVALDYEKNENEKIDYNNIINKIFRTKIDIEHIQSYNDENIVERKNIKKAWGKELNGLGNLVVLESGINKKISNDPFKIKKKSYQESEFKIVQELASKYDNWNIQDAEERRIKSVKKLKSYLFKY